MKELTSRQKQIINASINIISNGGIQELTMKNLSNALGLSEPALYRHFESKQDILLTMLNTFKYENRIINRNILSEGNSGLVHLKEILTGIFNKFQQNPAISAIIFSEELFQNESMLVNLIMEIMETNVSFFKEIIDEGQKDSSIRKDIAPEELSIIIMGSVRQLVTLWRLSGFGFNLIDSGKKLLSTLELLTGSCR